MKKRLPIEQLREAGKQAMKMLTAKGITAEKSIIEQILKEAKSPRLPGIPAYLPHKETLRIGREMMYKIILSWREECKVHPDFTLKKTKQNADMWEESSREQNMLEFFSFLKTVMDSTEKGFREDKEKMPELMKTLITTPVMGDVFAPMKREETTIAMHRFFVDALAVSKTLERHTNLSDFSTWFGQWTLDLYALWLTPEERDKLPKV